MVFEHETAPKKKYELGEELLERPDLMKGMLAVFINIDNDQRRKIRDLLLFLHTWTSNDAPESSHPRSTGQDYAKQFRDLLYECRHIFFLIVHEGRQDTDSITLFNDVIRVFVQYDECLVALFKDTGKDRHGNQKRERGCVWSVLLRLTEVRGQRGFHMIAGFFDALEMIFLHNHLAVNEFIDNNYTEFTRIFHELILLQNTYIQSKALHIINELFDNSVHAEIRRNWMEEANLMYCCTISLQSIHEPVLFEAIVLLNLYVQNPRNAEHIHQFIYTNRRALLEICFRNKLRGSELRKYMRKIELLEKIIERLHGWPALKKKSHSAPQSIHESDEFIQPVPRKCDSIERLNYSILFYSNENANDSTKRDQWIRGGMKRTVYWGWGRRIPNVSD